MDTVTLFYHIPLNLTIVHCFVIMLTTKAVIYAVLLSFMLDFMAIEFDVWFAFSTPHPWRGLRSMKCRPKWLSTSNFQARSQESLREVGGPGSWQVNIGQQIEGLVGFAPNQSPIQIYKRSTLTVLLNPTQPQIQDSQYKRNLFSFFQTWVRHVRIIELNLSWDKPICNEFLKFYLLYIYTKT